MFKFIQLIIVSVFLFIFGCSNNNQNHSKNEVNKTIIEKNSTVQETILNKMGFDFKNDKIIIDLNKSTNFFSKMGKKINEKSKEIENKIKSIDMNVSFN